MGDRGGSQQLMDLWGAALWDYYQGRRKHLLYLHPSYGSREKVPLDEFFRYDLKFPPLEACALEMCQGGVLDVGSGTGAHALALQEMNLPVTALEISPGACKVMRDRGVRSVINGDIFQYQGPAQDTLLLMMNGLGLAGTLAKLPSFLDLLKSKLKPGGQILVDSCDLAYLFRKSKVPSPAYYGELSYYYTYKKIEGEPFPWLFVDPVRLQSLAWKRGLSTQIIYQEDSQYLARLTCR